MMQIGDSEKIWQAFKNQGWSKNIETLRRYFHEQGNGERIVFVAHLENETAGYITVTKAKHGPWIGAYEAQDFNVFLPYRHQKIGYQLLQKAIDWTFARADCLTLAVGLHEGYGQAQKLYIRNGFIPDGGGAYYRENKASPYELYPLDDDLVIYLKKERYHAV